MNNEIHTAEELFNSLSEETVNALIKFMRLSPEDREQVLNLAHKISTNQ